MASNRGHAHHLACALLLLLLCVCRGVVVATQQPHAPARIALLHMYNGVSFFRRLGHLTGANKARYAARHGYDFVLRSPEGSSGLYRLGACPPGQVSPCWEDDPDFEIDAQRAPTFGKIKLAVAACNNRAGSWLLWSDADALIVNQTMPLEALIDDGYDIMVSYDWLMVQAGVILFKCSPFTLGFLERVYGDRTFDTARALDQSALQHYIDQLTEEEREAHVKFIPKHSFNAYLEEYRAGDFLVHMAGKLYEATEPGLWAIANQLDIFSIVDDVEDIDAFLSTRYLLNQFSGVCPVDKSRGERQGDCKPDDPRRFRLKESLGSMSTPNRYRHVAMRYYFLPNWTDKYDVPDWNVKRKELVRPGLTEDVPVTPHTFENSERPAPVRAQMPPTIDLVNDNSPPHHDSKGHDSGAKIPPPKRPSRLARLSNSSSSITSWLLLPGLVIVSGVGTIVLLYRRQVSQRLKQR